MKPNKGDFNSKYHKLPSGDLDNQQQHTATAAAAATAAGAPTGQQFVVRDTIVMVSILYESDETEYRLEKYANTTKYM